MFMHKCRVYPNVLLLLVQVSQCGVTFFNCFYWLCSTPRQRELFLTLFLFQSAFKVVLKAERHATHPETHSTLADYFFQHMQTTKKPFKNVAVGRLIHRLVCHKVIAGT